MFGYIYKITNKITSKMYIGKHKYDKPELDKSYIASGIYINRSIKLYGIENFKIELVSIAETESDLNQQEIYYINLYDTLFPNGYNLTYGGDGLSNPPDFIREKMSQKKIGTVRSEEAKRKTSESLKKVVHTEEWVAKIKLANAGKKPSEYTLKRSSETHKGSTWCNNGEIEKMIPNGEPIPNGYVKGRLKNPFPCQVGIKKSDNTIKKISAKKKNTFWINNGKIEKMIPCGTPIPNGFVIGRKKK